VVEIREKIGFPKEGTSWVYGICDLAADTHHDVLLQETARDAITSRGDRGHNALWKKLIAPSIPCQAIFKRMSILKMN
jgi:hypothetical protein